MTTAGRGRLDFRSLVLANGGKLSGVARAQCSNGTEIEQALWDLPLSSDATPEINKTVRLSAWIGYLHAYLPACQAPMISMLVPPRDLYRD